MHLASSRRRLSRAHAWRQLLYRVGIYVAYVAIALIVLFPLSWVLFGSFKSPSEIFAFPSTLFPRIFTWSNYVDVVRRTALPGYILNTVIVTGFTFLFTIVIASIAAYGFSRWDFRFKEAVMVTILVLQMLPTTVNIIPYYLMMDSVGLLNTRAALIIIYTATNIPFTIWIMKGYFDTIPRSLDEAAIIDGCTRFRVLRSIILPLSVPGIASAGFLVFLDSWSSFLVPLVISPARDVAVMSVGIYNFFGIDFTAYNHAFAASVMSVIPVLVVYLFAQEYLISGLSSGAEKG